jgi:hypothetical protein
MELNSKFIFVDSSLEFFQFLLEIWAWSDWNLYLLQGLYWKVPCGYNNNAAISNLILLQNKTTECQAKMDSIGLDVFYKIADVKREFLKYCKRFEAHLCLNVKLHHVIALGKELSTDIMIPRFIVEMQYEAPRGWALQKSTFNFWSTTGRIFWDSITTLPGSAICLKWMQHWWTSRHYWISLLMGWDREWARAADFAVPEAAAAVGAVLGAASRARQTNDYNSSSNDENSCDGEAQWMWKGPGCITQCSNVSVCLIEGGYVFWLPSFIAGTLPRKLLAGRFLW